MSLSCSGRRSALAKTAAKRVVIEGRPTPGEERAEEVAEPREILRAAPVFEANPGPARTGTLKAGEWLARPTTARAGLLVVLPVGAELVVQLPLLGIGEDLVGLAYFLEAFLGGGVALVDVRMVLPGKLAEGLLDVGLTGSARHAKRRVVVPVFHPGH